MERRKDAQPPEGQEPTPAVEIVAEVLKGTVKQSTFLVNAGLQSSLTRKKATNAVVAAHVEHLKLQLERSELQADAMRDEMAAMRKRSEEAEAAQAARDEAYELLRQKTQEQEEKFAHLMALMGARATGN